MSGNEKPRPDPPDEVELLKKYREMAMPAARLATLDEFAKWLFASISVVGSVAAAFSTSAIKGFSKCGAGDVFSRHCVLQCLQHNDILVLS